MEWYKETMEDCFPEVWKIPESGFLKIFAAPMCIPHNSSYGKCDEKRTKGHGPKRQPEVVRQDQISLLQQYEKTVEGWTETYKVKDGMYVLAQKFVDTMKTEENYAKDPERYTPVRYLSWFTFPKEGDKLADFRQVAKLYGNILEKLFVEMPEEHVKDALCAMEKRFGKLAPDGELPLAEDAGTYERMGTCLCSLLILDAAKDPRGQKVNSAELLYELFGIAPPDTGATRSVILLDSMTLKGPQFIGLCNCALRADLSLQEMELMYEVLAVAVKKLEGHLDPSIRWLIECYIEQLKNIGQKAAKALGEDVDDNQSEILFNTAKKLRNACKQWLA